MPQETATLDLDVMQQLLDLDDGATGLLEEMCQLFREDTPDRIRDIATAIHDGDMAAMADKAHAVKGAASTMGAPRVQRVAAILEHSGRDLQAGRPLGSDVDLKALVVELGVLFEEAQQALDAHIAGLK